MLDRLVDRYGSELFRYSSRIFSPGFSSAWPGVSDSISSLLIPFPEVLGLHAVMCLLTYISHDIVARLRDTVVTGSELIGESIEKLLDNQLVLCVMSP